MYDWLMGVWMRVRARYVELGSVLGGNFGGSKGGGGTRGKSIERSLFCTSEMHMLLVLCVSVVVSVGRG